MIQSEDNSRGKDTDIFFEYLKKLRLTYICAHLRLKVKTGSREDRSDWGDGAEGSDRVIVETGVMGLTGLAEGIATGEETSE